MGVSKLKTRKQHYIPQFLINKFRDRNGNLCVYMIPQKKILYNQNPLNFAQMRDMYNMEESDLREVLDYYIKIAPLFKMKVNIRDDQFIEDFFSNVEASTSIIINRILEQDMLILSETDKNNIILFLHVLAFRTKYYRDFRSVVTKKSNELLENFSRKRGIEESEYKRSFVETSKKVEMGSVFDIRSLLEFGLNISQHYYFCYAKNNSEIDFILSDNPSLQIHLGVSDFCFPISSRRAIVLRHKDIRSNRVCSINPFIFVMNLNYHDVMAYNLSNAENSHEIIFGAKTSVEIMSKVAKFKYFSFD
jgi:hypothetical protein